MPSSYAIMNEEEMTYIEGGGTTFSLSKSKCAQLATYIYLGGFGVTTSTALAVISGKLKAAGSAIVSLIKNVCTVSMGIVGRVIVGIVATLALTNIVSFAVNVVTADRKDKGCSMEKKIMAYYLTVCGLFLFWLYYC